MTQTSTGLPAGVAAAVRQLADQLHDAMRVEMVRDQPAPEVTLLWQAAKLINGAAGGLDFGDPQDPTDRHVAQWVDVAGIASDLADLALQIAAAGMSPAEAAAQQERIDVDALDWAEAAAYAGTIELSPPDPDGNSPRITVAIAGDPARTLTVTGDHGPALRPHTAASLLRVAHHLHRLGGALGDVVDDGQANPWSGEDAELRYERRAAQLHDDPSAHDQP
jgi:hypothetical protein